MGILEDIPSDEVHAPEPDPTSSAVDIGPAETPTPKPVAARKDPTIVGAGRLRSLDGNGTPPADWSTVGRNDPCPCGSGKKFKKCHGANL
jgi:preprotein translocase subunit SecA